MECCGVIARLKRLIQRYVRKDLAGVSSKQYKFVESIVDSCNEIFN